MCIAESVFLYQRVNYDVAAQKLIDADANVLVVFAHDRQVQSLFNSVDKLTNGIHTNFILLLTQQGDFDFLKRWRPNILGSLQFHYQEAENVALR